MHPKIDTPEYWSERYNSNTYNWDLRKETQVFVALREKNLLDKPTSSNPLKVVIPGCGFGYDAIGFAKAGYDVTAVDFAPEALDVLASNALNEGVEVSLLCRDIFDLGKLYPQEFDIAVEYTCYCAINPTRRDEYVSMLASITKRGGVLAGLFFPFENTPHISPPFSVQLDEITSRFEQAEFSLIHNEEPSESHPARAGRERLLLFKRL
jgi:methyl halide transferase